MLFREWAFHSCVWGYGMSLSRRTILIPPHLRGRPSGYPRDVTAAWPTATGLPSRKAPTMKGDESSVGRSPARGRAMLWTLIATPLVAAVVIASGVGLVAILGRRGDDSTWTRWSSVGQAFGVVNSVVSALAVAALVITWALQSRDLRDQRAELTVQRRILERAEAALCRSADVDVRKLHVTLIGMAVDNPHLAE